MHYKIIFLIISSNNEEIYTKMRELSPKFYELYPDKIKYFFIENKSDLNEIVIEDDNHLYINGTESFIPGIYQKSIKAIEYVTNNYSFDYIIRTNLSTFWHLPNLFKLLDSIPHEKFAGGYAFQGFISGTGIIMSRDVGIIVYSNPSSSYIGDDLAISQTIQANGISLYDIIEYKWGFLIPQNDILPSNCRYLDINENNFSDILNFRIKNGDRNIDVNYFKILLKKIYNIIIDGVIDTIMHNNAVNLAIPNLEPVNLVNSVKTIEPVNLVNSVNLVKPVKTMQIKNIFLLKRK